MAKNILNEVALSFNSFMRRMNAADPKKEQRLLQELRRDVFSTDDPEWAEELRRQQGEDNKYMNDHYPYMNDWKDLPEDGSDNKLADIIDSRANGDSTELEMPNNPNNDEDEDYSEEKEYNHDLGETPEGDENEWFDSDDEGVDGDDDYLEEATSSFKSLMERMDYVQKNGSISLNEISSDMHKRAMNNYFRKLSNIAQETGYYPEKDEKGRNIDRRKQNSRYLQGEIEKQEALESMTDLDPLTRQACERFNEYDIDWDGFEREYGEVYGSNSGGYTTDDGWEFIAYAYQDGQEASPEIEEVEFISPDGERGRIPDSLF